MPGARERGGGGGGRGGGGGGGGGGRRRRRVRCAPLRRVRCAPLRRVLSLRPRTSRGERFSFSSPPPAACSYYAVRVARLTVCPCGACSPGVLARHWSTKKIAAGCDRAFIFAGPSRVSRAAHRHARDGGVLRRAVRSRGMAIAVDRATPRRTRGLRRAAGDARDRRGRARARRRRADGSRHRKNHAIAERWTSMARLRRRRGRRERRGERLVLGSRRRRRLPAGVRKERRDRERPRRRRRRVAAAARDDDDDDDARDARLDDVPAVAPQSGNLPGGHARGDARVGRQHGEGDHRHQERDRAVVRQHRGPGHRGVRLPRQREKLPTADAPGRVSVRHQKQGHHRKRRRVQPRAPPDVPEAVHEFVLPGSVLADRGG